MPLYRDAAATEPNILPGFLDLWGKKLKREITPESFIAYCYGLLGHSGFVEHFWGELEDCELRVPLTLNAKLFCDVYAAGAMLLHLHTFGERFQPPRTRTPQIPSGKARVKEAISDKPADYPEKYEYIEQSKTLRVGHGAIAPIDPAVWNYEVSGLRVVHSWLGYRMKDRKGKKSSPLDDIHPERWTSDFTDELLRVLWILEETLRFQPRLDRLLDRVCAGPLLPASALPRVPLHLRKPPRACDEGVLFGGDDSDETDTDE
jgi:Type ISP C-terminal specificity domain